MIITVCGPRGFRKTSHFCLFFFFIISKRFRETSTSKMCGFHFKLLRVFRTLLDLNAFLPKFQTRFLSFINFEKFLCVFFSFDSHVNETYIFFNMFVRWLCKFVYIHWKRQSMRVHLIFYIFNLRKRKKCG